MAYRTYITRSRVEAYIAKGWILETVYGSAITSQWAWIREFPGSANVKYVRMNTARSLAKKLKHVVTQERPRKGYFIKP